MDEIKEIINTYEVESTDQSFYQKINQKFNVFFRLHLLQERHTNEIDDYKDLQLQRVFVKSKSYYIYEQVQTKEIVLIREVFSDMFDFRYEIVTLPPHTEEEYKKLLLVDELETESNKPSYLEVRLLFGTVIVPIVLGLQMGTDLENWYYYTGAIVVYLLVAIPIVRANRKARREEIRRNQEKYRN